MKKNLTKAILAIMLIVAAVPCLAQQRSTISFSYDANGNRIARSLSMKRVYDNPNPTADYGAQAQTEDNADYLASATDIFEAMEVGLYPNPTQDILNLSIENANESAVLSVVLTTLTGDILFDKKVVGVCESVDLTSYPAGIYYLILKTEKEQHSWKIVKY